MGLEKIMREIAGEIALSDDPGSTLKKWREIFGISQGELSKHLHISVSTISDYESGRRRSPGIAVVKRFVNALFEIDKKKGGHITKKLTQQEQEQEEYFEIHEFARGITLKEFVDAIKGIVLTNKEVIDEKKIYGYTLIDSIRTILEMPFSLFTSLYGHINERVFIFTGVSTGRSPMVVIRVAPSKPSAVVLHGIKDPKKVDLLAIKISEREGIPLIYTKMPISEIKDRLNRL